MEVPARYNNEATFEGLPVELKVLILRRSADVSALRDLVLSSRSYCKAYLGQRQSILQEVLTIRLGSSVLCDAHSVVKAQRIGSSTLLLNANPDIEEGRLRSQWLSNTTQFLRDYRKGDLDAPQKIEPQDLEEMSRLACSVDIVARELFKATLTKHPLTGQDTGLQFENLSTTELQRIYGALIRFQICCALWGDHGRVQRGIQLYTGSGIDLEDLAKLFLSKLQPWEVEEIARVRDFYFRFYDQVYMECRKELEETFYAQKSGKNMNKPVSEERKRDILSGKNKFYYSNLSETLTSYGVDLCAKMACCYARWGLLGMKDHKVQYLKEYGNDLIALNYRLWETFISSYLKQYWWPRSGTPQAGLTLKGESCPNAAWVRYVAGPQYGPTPTNISAPGPLGANSRVSLRQWGFVMWDETRLEKLGVMKEMDAKARPDDPYSHSFLWNGHSLVEYYASRGPAHRINYEALEGRYRDM